MNDNVYKVLDRGEKIEVLVDKTESMQTQANRFNKAGSALKDKMFWAALRAKLLFIVIGIVVVLGIIFTICGSSLCGLIGSGGEEPAPEEAEQLGESLLQGDASKEPREEMEV